MSDGLPETALGAFLKERGVDGTLVRSGDPMPTVPLAAAALGVAPGQIVKSIVFQHKKDPSRVCLAIVAGDARVHPGKVGRALGLTQLKLASPGATLAATGYAVGGVPPVGHPSGLPVVIDAAVMRQASVFGGGGDEHHMLRISPGEIQRHTRGAVADITTGEPQAGAVTP